MLDSSNSDSDTKFESEYPRNPGPFKDNYGDDPRNFFGPLRIRKNGEDSKAREEWFFESLKLFCCPKLNWLTFISIISIIEIIVFIVSLCIFGLSNDSFLAPD